MNKYKLTKETKELRGYTLRRIRALTDFSDVKAGDLGGWIESERNLSQSDGAWVYDNAWVFDDAYVFGDARVCDKARIFGNAWVYDNAFVYDDANVYGDARVFGNAYFYDNANLFGYAYAYGNARVFGNAWVYDNARVCGDAWVNDNAFVYNDASVYGDARVFGNARVCGDAEIREKADFLHIANIGTLENATIYRGKNNSVLVTCGCFYGTLDEFADKIRTTHGDSSYGKEYAAVIELAKTHFGVHCGGGR